MIVMIIIMTIIIIIIFITLTFNSIMLNLTLFVSLGAHLSCSQ